MGRVIVMIRTGRSREDLVKLKGISISTISLKYSFDRIYKSLEVGNSESSVSKILGYDC